MHSRIATVLLAANFALLVQPNTWVPKKYYQPPNILPRDTGIWPPSARRVNGQGPIPTRTGHQQFANPIRSRTNFKPASNVATQSQWPRRPVIRPTVKAPMNQILTMEYSVSYKSQKPKFDGFDVKKDENEPVCANTENMAALVPSAPTVDGYTLEAFTNGTGKSSENQDKDQKKLHAGDMIYFKLKDNLPRNHKFAPTRCTLQHGNFIPHTLFEFNDMECTGDTQINMKMCYNDNDRAWRFQHNMFVLVKHDTEKEINANKLKMICDVTVCDKNESNSVCDDVENKCNFAGA